MADRWSARLLPSLLLLFERTVEDILPPSVLCFVHVLVDTRKRINFFG